ncbi:MAG: homoserine dehydrogenase, partial [Caldilineae bacterium]
MNEIPLILFGLGGVGRSFVRQILDLRDYHADKYDLHLRFLAFCDSRGAVLEPTEGFSDQQVHELLQLKEQGGSLSQHLLGGIQDDLAAIVDIAGQPGTIVVDCTATEATVPALFLALDRNYQVVLANKKPLTMQQEVYDRLTRAGTTAGDPITLSQSRWETTVGAGLPVIATLNRLVASGDEIVRIAGAFSGTLGYVMTGLQEGRAFSEIVQDAYRQGYTEPDPRDDLGGVDVARKALILARGMGWRLDLSDVSVQSLYPEALAERTVD